MTDVDLYTWTKPDGVRYHFRDDRLSWLYQREGGIYISADPTSPAEIFGGSWERITGRFLLGTDTTENDPGTYPAGSTGGEATVTLTANQSGQRALSISGGGHSHTIKLKGGLLFQIGTNRRGYNNTGTEEYTASSGIAANTGTHSHTVSAANATEAHNNMPPYLAVYIWKRVA